MGKVIQNSNTIANFNGAIIVTWNGGLFASEINPLTAEYTAAPPEETET